MAHLEWSGLMNADGTKQMVWVDDPADVEAKNAAQNATTPGALATKYPGGYTLGDYYDNIWVGNDMAGVEKPSYTSQTASPKVLAARKKAKATEDARQEQKRTAQSVVNATRDSLLGTIDKKWRWRS